MGAPGSGKSLVARCLAEAGAAVIDADQLAREALATEPVMRRLKQWWGPGVIDAQGAPDRKAIGAIVFEDPDQLKRLEAVVHPQVHQARRALRQRYGAEASVKAIVEDCPLLLETGLDRECDVLVLVDTPREQRLRRVQANRGWDEAELARREKRQWPLDIKRQHADYVVCNDADEQAACRNAHRVLAQILADDPPRRAV